VSTRAVLEAKRTPVAEERSAKRAPLSPADVRALLAAVDEVWIARGRAVDRRPARRVRLAELKGPTGKFRAPMLRIGRVLLVGLQRESLAELLG
jgi:hypothetical protein